MKNVDQLQSVLIRKIDSFENESGIIEYCNELILNKYRRFYTITHPDTNKIRAWQAHSQESKCFVPLKGRFIVSWVKIDCFKNPSLNLKAESIILDSTCKKLVEIPKGYANGLKALEPNSELLVFSEFFLEKSLKEKVRFDSNLWFNWNKYD